MILRKPYAFLIKNFKIIHLLLLLPLSYLIYKSYYIIVFFNDFVKNNYTISTSVNLSSKYLSYFMYLALIIILIVLIAIYWLLQHKNKPRKFYVLAIIYYIFLFVMIAVTYNIFTIVQEETLETATIRAYRDLSIIIPLPQLIFIIYIFISGIGLNLKKYKFAEDLKEIEIKAEDSEEFEFTVGFESYKTKRTVRRFIREFIYYVRENTFIFSCLVIITFIIIGTSIYLNREVYDKSYRENELVLNNKFNFSVQDSIITNLSYNGKVINSKKNYLVLKLQITNVSSLNVALDYSNYKVIVKKNSLTPNLKLSNYFIDYATPYLGEKINKNKTRIISLVYELNENQIQDSYILKVYRGSVTKPGEILSQYNKIKIKPIIVNKTGSANAVSLSEELSLANSNLGNSSFTINTYSFAKKYIYTYEKCYEINDCRNVTNEININYLKASGPQMLMILDYKFVLDNESVYANYNNTLTAFLKNFLKIKYKLNDQEKYATIQNLTPNNLSDKLILQIEEEVSEAEELQIIFSIRNKNYLIILK